MTEVWNGLGVGLANVWRLADAETRSISPENLTGEKGRGGMAVEGTGAGPGRDLGQGWKISPSVTIAPGATFVLADIEGSGAIQHIWLTPMGGWRDQILRMYWDDDPQPRRPGRSATTSSTLIFADLRSSRQCRSTDGMEALMDERTFVDAHGVEIFTRC